MKILILGDQARYEKYMPALPFIRQQELVFLDKSSSLSTVLAADRTRRFCSWMPSRQCRRSGSMDCPG